MFDDVSGGDQLKFSIKVTRKRLVQFNTLELGIRNVESCWVKIRASKLREAKFSEPQEQRTRVGSNVQDPPSGRYVPGNHTRQASMGARGASDNAALIALQRFPKKPTHFSS